jgi:ComF family protein
MAILYSKDVKMTSLLEKLIEKIAPHHCISCGSEDNILCAACAASEIIPLLPVCCLCGKLNGTWQVCDNHALLGRVWAAGSYEGLLEKLIHVYKFERARAADDPLSRLMLRVLPYDDWLIIPIPTAPSRVRQRGYDQSLLLAKRIAAERQLELSPALGRLQNVRQVGATRVQRQKQSIQMFFINNTKQIRGAKILLVDDVCTTGATLNAAAHTLREAGAARVDAVVAAYAVRSDLV